MSLIDSKAFDLVDAEYSSDALVNLIVSPIFQMDLFFKMPWREFRKIYYDYCRKIGVRRQCLGSIVIHDFGLIKWEDFETGEKYIRGIKRTYIEEVLKKVEMNAKKRAFDRMYYTCFRRAFAPGGPAAKRLCREWEDIIEQ